jgi:two-component system, chemotaxis family, chemotaxis protein CheY
MDNSEQHDFTDIIETLEQLEQGLIEYEDVLEGGSTDDSIIHILFRYAHNLKSSLGMARKNHSSELTHSVENNFDLIRSGKMGMSRGLIDKSLEAVDLIKANLYREEETADELQALKETIDAIKEEPGEKKEAAINFLLSDEEKSVIANEVSSGRSVYLVEKLIKTDIDKEGYENLPIYEDIKAIGKLIAKHPDYEHINRKSEEGVVKILFATSMTDDELYFEIFDPMQKIEFDISSAPSTPPPGKTEKKEDLSILIVEDDFTTRHLEMKILKAFGTCEIAVDGHEAVSAYERKMLDNEHYDCIFLDIIIPGIDGHAVLKRIRETEAERGIHGFERTKIIIVSNLRDMENISKSFREQSDSYIVKPVTKKKVEQELVRLHLL